jgi:collagenase-like PrtC family protease
MSNGGFKMKYSIATNFDTKLIEGIAKLDTDKSIASVYGKLKSDIVGGGRASAHLPELQMSELKNYIKLCHENGLTFNYLLNPMCLANKQFERSTRNEIMTLLEGVVDAGTDWLTINSPYLCQVVKKQFPDVKVSVGVHALAYELQHIKFWEDMGADEVTLQMHVSRNFPLLEKMLNYSKGSGIAIRIFGNHPCLYNCAYRIQHATGQAHASRTGDGAGKFVQDISLMTCTTEKIKDPAKLMSAGWIRPEDVKYYEELCDRTGNYNFSIKLVERTKTTDFLLRVVKAYLSRSYDGNLLDLMFWPDVKEFVTENNSSQKVYNSVEIDDSELFKGFLDFFMLPNIYIDNKKLDGFFGKFVSGYDCDKKVCSDSISRNNKTNDNSLMCSYCEKWSGKAIKLDKQEADQWIIKASSVLEDIRDGKRLL